MWSPANRYRRLEKVKFQIALTIVQPHIYPYINDIISINYLISRIDDALEAQVASFSCFSNFSLKRRSDLTLEIH